MADDPRTLVSTSWLADRLQDPDLRVLDGSWYLPAAKRDPKAEYAAAHIPGAQFFDIDDLSDDQSSLPHMAPPVEKFVSRMRALGVGDGHRVVVYDGAGIYSAARVWWLLRLMGKEEVAVLDGGLPKWQAEGRPLDADIPIPRDRHVTVTRRDDLVTDVTGVSAASKLGTAQIIDARPHKRFTAEVQEPRAGLRSGHMPGAKSVPHDTLLKSDGTMKRGDDLRAAFESAGVDLDRPAITTCGSGVTAAVLSLGLQVLGHRDHALYDGSWAEWGQFEYLPIETGE